MPRDISQHEQGLVDLPGQRKGRLVPSDDAGQFRVQLQGNSLVDRLAEIGVVTRDQLEAGQRLAQPFEATSLRPGLTGSYSPVVDGHGNAFALERLDAAQLRAWRQLGRLLDAVPSNCRPAVEAAAIWDQKPDSITALRIGLAAVALAIRRPRR